MAVGDWMTILNDHNIRPSAQRVAHAECVLTATDHPSADQVWSRVRKSLPMVSRATTYNTLSLFVRRGLLRQLEVAGSVVYDPNTQRHHHLIDEETKEIHDIPWEALDIRNVEQIADFEVEDYQVVLRGRRKTDRRLTNGGE